MSAVAFVGKIKKAILDKLNLRESDLNKLNGSTVTIEVGYDQAKAPYAIYVHENPNARHQSPYGKGGKWKFLEDPAKEITNLSYGTHLVIEGLKQGLTLEQCLYNLGNVLKTNSQLQVPYDTGNLHDSAYVTIES